MSDRSRWLMRYSCASFVHAFGWGLYFPFARLYLKEVLGANYFDILALTAAEWGPACTSALWGRLADKYGRRVNLLLGSLLSLPLVFVGSLNIPLVQMAVAMASLAWAVAWPSAVTPLVSRRGLSGSAYGFFSFMGSVGWALGSSVMGLAYVFLGPYSVSLMAGASVSMAYLLFYLSYHFADDEVIDEEGGWMMTLKCVYPLLVGAGISYFGLEWANNVLAIKLLRDLRGDEILYGIIYGGLASFTSAVMRPLAGKLVDKKGSNAILISALVSYFVLINCMARSKGALTAILWLIPIYPFYDVGLVVAVSGSVGSGLKATGIGLLNTLISASCLLLPLAGGLTDRLGVVPSLTLASLLQLAALPLFALHFTRRSRP